MADPQEFARRVSDDEDFIALKRFGYSVASLRERYPDGCPNHIIASALLVTEEGVDQLWDSAVAHLREILGTGPGRPPGAPRSPAKGLG